MEYLPEDIKYMAPYVRYVKNVNQTIVEKMFSLSWKKYGAGKILSKTAFFEDYLSKTKKLIDYFT